MILFFDACHGLTPYNKYFIYINRPADGDPGMPDSSEHNPAALSDNQEIRGIVRNSAACFFEGYKGTAEEPGITDKIEKLGKRENLERKATELLAEFIEENADRIISIKARTKPGFEGEQTETLEEMLGSVAYGYIKLLCEATLEIDKHMKIEPKTGLLNRRALDEDLAEAVERNLRQPGDEFSFLFLDLDHFTEVNNTYGHQVGDQVLKEVSRRLKEEISLRKLDSAYRFGGEEFSVLLPSTSFRGAVIVADKISKAIGAVPFKVRTDDGNDIEINVTVSIGISQYTRYDDDRTGEQLIANADHCTYVLKGRRPDTNGTKKNRRGQIACDVYSIANEGRETLISTDELGTLGRRMNRAEGIDRDAVIVTPSMTEAYRVQFSHADDDTGTRETKPRPLSLRPRGY